MKIGVISEGHNDRKIIQSLLKGLRGVDGSDILALRPEEQKDETDKSRVEANAFSTWSIVLKECENKTTFESFFDIVDEERYLVVQIDTAECTDAGYDVVRPSRSGGNIDWQTYSTELRQRVTDKLQSLIPPQYHDRVLYAICVEETDAWLIPIWKNEETDSAKYANPKEVLQNLISRLSDKEKRKYIDTQKKGLSYEALSKEWKKKTINKCRKQNKSLDLFCTSIEEELLGTQ